jgi:hypothetical protein
MRVNAFLLFKHGGDSCYKSSEINVYSMFLVRGHAVMYEYMVEALCYKPKGGEFESR